MLQDLLNGVLTIRIVRRSLYLAHVTGGQSCISSVRLGMVGRVIEGTCRHCGEIYLAGSGIFCGSSADANSALSMAARGVIG